MLAVVVLAVALGGAAAATIIVRSHGNGTSGQGAGTPSPAAPQPSPTQPRPTPTATVSPQPPEQQAARSLAGLLAQSVADRGSIDNAYRDVMRCGPNLSRDAAAFRGAATSRQNLLSRLSGIPGKSALPASMIQALTKAWQASIQADQDLAAWAHDENSQGCIAGDTADLNFRAATGPDLRATRYKRAFVGQWNPIAARYGLPSYTQRQL